MILVCKSDGWYVVDLKTKTELSGPHTHPAAIEAAAVIAYRIKQGWSP